MSTRAQLIMLPGPTNVPPRVMNAMLNPIIDHRGPEFHELYDSIIENLRYLFQTKNDIFVLTTSGTGGVECAISNVISPNDKVIVPVGGVFGERLEETVKRFGGMPIRIPIEWHKAVTPEQVASVIEKEEEVKAIALVYNETSTGVTVRELEEIGKIAKKHDMLHIVDAISILGGDYLPVDNWNVDICIGGSQKCLACPPGVALISVSERAWETIKKNKPRSFYFDLIRESEFQKERKETAYTPALPIFYALDEALKILKEEGLEKRIERHRTCAKAFYSAIEALGLKLFADEKYRSNTVIAVNVPSGVEDKTLRSVMKERYGVVIAGGMGKLRGKIFRIGNMGIVSKTEVLITISALENALVSVGYGITYGTGISAAEEVFSKE